MTVAVTRQKAARVGPYCRAISKGIVGDAFDGRSREGKFLRRCEAEIVSQLGGDPSFTQTLLVRRVARLMLQAELFDVKLASGEAFTGHDGRTYGGIQNAIRAGLRDIGLKSVPKDKPLALADIFARHAAKVPPA